MLIQYYFPADIAAFVRERIECRALPRAGILHVRSSSQPLPRSPLAPSRPPALCSQSLHRLSLSLSLSLSVSARLSLTINTFGSGDDSADTLNTASPDSIPLLSSMFKPPIVNSDNAAPAPSDSSVLDIMNARFGLQAGYN